MHPHRTTRPRDARRATLLIAAVMGSAALAGCGSSGGLGTVSPTGGPTLSVGYSRNTTFGITNDRSRPGTNGTSIVQTANAATFKTTVGPQRIDTTLPLLTTQTTPLSSTFNSSFTERDYGRRTGTPGTSDRREETLNVVEAQYARLAQYDVENLSGRVGQIPTRVVAVGPIDQSTVRAVPTAGTASYRGFASGGSVQRNVASQRTDFIFGPVDLEADFGAGTVNGTIQDSQTGLVATMDGTITGTDYAGDITSITSGGRTAIDTSGGNDRAAFTGGFYGPNAEETAGLIDISGTDVQTQQRTEVVGGFIATKQ